MQLNRKYRRKGSRMRSRGGLKSELVCIVRAQRAAGTGRGREGRGGRPAAAEFQGKTLNPDAAIRVD
jgi:hypothetical protein